MSHHHTSSTSTSGGVACSVRATAANLAVVSWLLPLLGPLGPQDIYPAGGDRQCLHPFLLCVLTHLPPMFLLGNHSILVFLLLSLARTAFRDLAGLCSTCLCNLHVPCLFHTLRCFIVIQDGILMHPAFHVGLGSTCRHISTFPASGSCDMLSFSCLFSVISITFRFLAPTRKGASTVLLFPFVLQIGLAPDNPVFLLL
jgi:hypothetical protein